MTPLPCRASARRDMACATQPSAVSAQSPSAPRRVSVWARRCSGRERVVGRRAARLPPRAGHARSVVRGGEPVVETLSDKKRDHLRTIRSIANRMRAGSALIRLWSVTVVAALVALATTPAHARFTWLALAMALGFWLLDAHFSRQERLFRKTYERVSSLAESEIDFDAGTAPVDGDEASFSTLFLSRGLSAFYGTVVVLIVLIRLVLTRGP